MISVPEQTEDIIDRLNSSGVIKGGEIKARCTAHETPLWTPEEIRQIAAMGFAALNADVDAGTVEKLTKNAYRNPLLMQSYCLRLCHKLKIERTFAERKRFAVPDATADEILRHTAAAYQETYAAYLKVKDAARLKWKIKSGKDVTTPVLVLIALASIAINKPFKLRTIRDRMKAYLELQAAVPSTERNSSCPHHLG